MDTRSTAGLKEIYTQIIDRLDALYTLALNHDWTAEESAEAAALQEQALVIYTELAQRELLPTLTA